MNPARCAYRSFVGFSLLATMALLSCAASPAASASLEQTAVLPEHLSCDGREHALGVQNAKPRFAWTLALHNSATRDVMQSSYRVLVASSHQLLAANLGDVWDSGRIASSSIFGIQYAGKPLTSHTRYYWKVRIWDARNRASAWSTWA